jgi:hypothetical protein
MQLQCSSNCETHPEGSHIAGDVMLLCASLSGWRWIPLANQQVDCWRPPSARSGSDS